MIFNFFYLLANYKFKYIKKYLLWENSIEGVIKYGNEY